jgi:hypothetical protein
VPWLLFDEYQQHVFVNQGLWDEGRNYQNILTQGTQQEMKLWGAFMTQKQNRGPSVEKPSMTSKENKVNQVKH